MCVCVCIQFFRFSFTSELGLARRQFFKYIFPLRYCLCLRLAVPEGLKIHDVRMLDHTFVYMLFIVLLEGESLKS